MFKTIGRLAAVVAVGALAFTGIAGTAQAKDVETARATAVVQPSVNTVGSPQIKDGQVYGWDMANNTIPWLKMGSQLRGEIRLGQQRGAEALAKANEALARPVLGKSGETVNVAPKLIANLGGKYFGETTDESDDRFTTLGSLTLGKGTWLINTSAKFHRTATGVEGTRPQLGLRIGQDQTLTGDAKWGKDAGTVGGNEISPGNGHDLFSSATKTITLTGTTTIGVYGFGYNSDTGTAGSGQIQASAEITPVLVG